MMIEGLVYDQNQVLVSGTETNVQFWYKYQSPIFFSENETFFFSKNFKFLSCFPLISWGYNFLQASKIFKLWQQNWF
jgi:hypothetical protein